MEAEEKEIGEESEIGQEKIKEETSETKEEIKEKSPVENKEGLKEVFVYKEKTSESKEEIPEPKEKSIKEQRIRNITQLYYSRKDVQDELFEFSKNREVVPRYFEGFGKRPDSWQYPGDVIELARRGATSFHCSEEIWEDPMELSTSQKESELNNLRKGWDLLIDVDCKWFDYSKLAAQAIVQVLTNHNLNSIGVKFSGSKGWHIIVPWKAFPKEIGGANTKDLFPEVPRKLAGYIGFESEKILKKNLPQDFYDQFKNVKIKKGIKCNNCKEIVKEYDLVFFFCNLCKSGEERKFDISTDSTKIFKCPNCRREFNITKKERIYECNKCDISSKNNFNNFSISSEVDLFDLMGLDIILVSPRHLFRMPYSLHEKTALASIVIDKEKISEFQMTDADPLKVKVKHFYPDAIEGEAQELLVQALDWHKENKKEEKDYSQKFSEKNTFGESKYQEVILDKSRIIYPPAINQILQTGFEDGKKRALFILLNYLRCINLEFSEIEKIIDEWNNKNPQPLKEGYIKSQIFWQKRNKKILPPNYDKDYYKGIGIIPTEQEMRLKNPVAYTIREAFKLQAKDEQKAKKYPRKKK